MKRFNIIEYQEMLERSFDDFSYQRLIQLGTGISEVLFAHYAEEVRLKKFDLPFAVYKETLDWFRKISPDPQQITYGDIDHYQKSVINARMSFARKFRVKDGPQKTLKMLIDKMESIVNFIKTKDPLYLITVWQFANLIDEEIHDARVIAAYQSKLLPEFADQVALLRKLGIVLGIAREKD